MTKHVRSSYRRHRRATWGLATALVLALAAVAIPIASGAPDKTYTLQFPATGAVTPALIATGNSTTLQQLCTDTTYTSVKLTISNTAPNAQLGSADVTFPVSIGTLSGTPTFTPAPNGAATISRAPAPNGNVVRLRNLSLPKRTGTATFSVTLNTGSSAVTATDITARVKQSNDFSDAGTNPDANAFDNPSFPRLTLQTCNAKISGLVYHDRDQSGGFAINANSPTSDVIKPDWTVTLFRQTGATYTNVDSAISAADGTYEVEGPAGSNYRVCVRAVTPPASSADSASAWAVRSTPGVTLTTGCTDITASSPDSRGLSVLNLPTAGVINQNFAVVPVTVFNFGAGSPPAGSGNYVVTAGGDTTKVAQHYVQETWISNDRPFFVFAPINACTGCGDIYLLEHLQGTIAQSALGPTKQVSLVYDDTEPFTVFLPMPYCLQDPRGTSSTDLLTDDVLPDGATSCIVEGHQTVDGDGTPGNAFVDFEFFVYSSYDGGRGAG